jgi:Protein of unknown function (DUF5672)
MHKSITVVALTACNIDEHAYAIDTTVRAIPQAKRLLISPVPPDCYPYDGEWRQLEQTVLAPWHTDYALRKLGAEIKTDIAVTVHHDGYVINPERWTDEFLDYDYIGAPWGINNVGEGQPRVGNGAFSLRSKKWLDLGAVFAEKYGLPSGAFNEDVLSCHTWRQYFIAEGCKIAPLELAMRWSHEHQMADKPDWDRSQSFGFHNFHPPNQFKTCWEDGCVLPRGHRDFHFRRKKPITMHEADCALNVLGDEKVSALKIIPPLGSSKLWRLTMVIKSAPLDFAVVDHPSLTELTQFASKLILK